MVGRSTVVEGGREGGRERVIAQNDCVEQAQ